MYCMNNVPTKRVANHFKLPATQEIDTKLGQPFSLDFQCAMEFGKRFKLCDAVSVDKVCIN